METGEQVGGDGGGVKVGGHRWQVGGHKGQESRGGRTQRGRWVDTGGQVGRHRGVGGWRSQAVLQWVGGHRGQVGGYREQVGVDRGNESRRGGGHKGADGRR